MDAEMKPKLQLVQLKRDLLAQTEFAEGLQKHQGLRDATQELSVVDNHPADATKIMSGLKIFHCMRRISCC